MFSIMDMSVCYYSDLLVSTYDANMRELKQGMTFYEKIGIIFNNELS